MRGGRVPFLLLSNFILPGNLKRGNFFKQKPAYSSRERREEYCHTRAVARRYPTDRTTTNKRVLGRKKRRGRPFAFRRVAPHFIPVNYFSKTRYAFWALYRISVQCHSKSGKIHYPLLFPKFYVCR